MRLNISKIVNEDQVDPTIDMMTSEGWDFISACSIEHSKFHASEFSPHRDPARIMLFFKREDKNYGRV